jgi:hypothetical protein
MRKLNFRSYFEAVDIFGFGRDEENREEDEEILDNKPMKTFNVDLMIEYLSKLKVGTSRPNVKFMNEIQWGDSSGAVRLEVSPSNTFYVKKLGKDLEGNERWVTKKVFQLNRNGFGGYEESVCQEIFGIIEENSKGTVDRAVKDWDGMEDLVNNIATKMRRVARDIFTWEGTKKVSRDNYIIVFEVAGQGVQARDQLRIEENCTQVSYDPKLGIIRVMNYKVASSLGQHEWKVMPSDLDCCFFPSQQRDEISEAVATFIKYY